MSYIAVATNSFDDATKFYGEQLGFPVVEQWDRDRGRGKRFDLGGLRVEILDNTRERKPLKLGNPADRIHVVIEVDDIETARDQIRVATPAPRSVSWGANLIQIRDPDGVPVTFLQWTGVS